LYAIRTLKNKKILLSSVAGRQFTHLMGNSLESDVIPFPRGPEISLTADGFLTEVYPFV
jgi:hypothetical protein